ncbi:PEGA domain-containing protein [Methanogenium cariaci]|jgi:PEGA domain-containing protein
MTSVDMQHGRNLLCLLIAIYVIIGFAMAGPPTILITSSPSGAGVYIGGTYKGDTPLDLTGRYSPGTYSIEIQKDGYVSWLGSMVVKESETTSISATLTPYKGNADISSTPAGATIYLDGNYAGIAPRVITDIPTGIHTISLKQDGYYDWNSEIEIFARKTVTISARMEIRDAPYDGSINIQSTPSNAEVYINDEFKGHTPLIIRELGPSNYHINLKLAGYQDWDVSVDVSENEQEKISANLYPSTRTASETATPTSPIIPIISTGVAGLALYCTQKKNN